MTDIEKQLAEIHSVLNAIKDETKMLLKMQKSILQGQKHYHIVGGYVWGNTADGASFLVLYPKSDKLKEKVCRVYADDYQFTDIPESIRATQEDTGLDTPKDKEWAQKKGVYHVCPAMGVITMDGKETQMGHEKRFAGVLWVAKTRQDRPAPVPPPTVPPVEKTAAPLPPPPTSQNGNGNGSKSQNGNTPRPDIFTQRAEAIYAHNAQIALAALCRQASGGKRSALAELDATQMVALDTSLVLRMELHSIGAAKYGGDWAVSLQKAVRGRNELYDLDAELTDEAIRQMIAAIQKK